MSMRAWARPLGVTMGVAAVAGAAQLGIAYGIAILLWARHFTDPGEGAWAGNLTWVCWLAAASVVLGVVIGRRIVPHTGFPRSVLAQLATVSSAAVGALVTVPLVGIPARYAELAGDQTPAATASRIALVGVLLGAVVSFGVLLGRPLEWNTLATTGLLWVLAFGSVLVSLGRGAPPDSVRLAVWRYAESPGWFAVMAPMLVAALALGAGLAWLAKRQGHSRVAVAVCGAPGPLVVAVAYLVAGPGTRPESGEQFLPYLAAPYAVLTGLLGSLLVAAIERPEPEESASDLDSSPVAAIAAGPAEPFAGTTSEVSPSEAGATLEVSSSGTGPGVEITRSDVSPTESVRSEISLTESIRPDARLPELAVPGWHVAAPAGESETSDPDNAAEEPEATRPGLDEDEEWLRQIRGARPRTIEPAPPPEPQSPRRRKWSLFSDDAVNDEESAGDQR
jgi:hypothetical protein